MLHTSVIVEDSSWAQARSGTGVRRRALRPGWGAGRGTRPESRPVGSVPAPQLSPGPPGGPIGCRVVTPAEPVIRLPVAAGTYRLTERGIALVLATGLAIAAVALLVVSLTALRVTGDAYLPPGQVFQQR